MSVHATSGGSVEDKKKQEIKHTSANITAKAYRKTQRENVSALSKRTKSAVAGCQKLIWLS